MLETPTTINEIFMKAVEQYNSPRAFGYKCHGRWVEVSHAEALRRVRSIALGLYAIGVRKSEYLLLLGENSLEWILADLGTLCCGAADVPLYHNSTAAQVEYIARDSLARVAFVSSAGQLEKLESMRSGLMHLQRVILLAGPPFMPGDGWRMTLADLERLGEELARKEPELFDSLWRNVDASDLATLIYTSGTTGNPKGVLLSHGNIASNVLAAHQALNIKNEAEIGLSYLPFSHVFERNNLYVYVHAGIPLYLAESLNSVAENLREVRPTMMTNVPRMFEKIYQKIVVTAAAGSAIRAALVNWCLDVGRRYAKLSHHGKSVRLALRLGYWLAYLLMFRHWRARMGGRIRYLISGGAPLSAEIAYLFLAGRLVIFQGYGLTETSPVISVNPSDANRIGTVGKPVPGVQVRIAEDGEILVRGPNVMSGYFRREAETQAAFADGWFKTGDLGYLDADGYLVVTDRKKDLIKTSGGKYVAPLHIENLILSSRFIDHVMVIGNERRFPSALIVPNAEMIRSYAALKGISVSNYSELLKHPRVISLIKRQVAKFTEGLAQYEKIKRIALLDHEFSAEGGELTLTLKLRRSAVESKYMSLIDSLYEEEGLPIGEPEDRSMGDNRTR